VSHLIPLSPDWAVWRVAAVRGAGMPVDWLGALAERPGRAPCALAGEPERPAGQPDSVAGEPDGVSSLLAKPVFVAALTWQNPDVMTAWLGPLIAEGATARASRKINSYRSAKMLARYAQRYCAKNESIGFFGPVGWARLTDDPDELAVSGGAGIRRGEVFLEHWAVELIARTIEADPRVRSHLPVRRHAAVFLDGATARRPWRSAVQLDGRDLAVLEQVADGVPAGQIEPAEALRRLEAAGIVRAGFAVPVGERPQDALREQLGRLPDADLRAELLGSLDELERARLAAAAVMTDPVPLQDALADLSRVFTKLTGVAATRTRTAAAAGLTVAYPDCRRDLDVTVGRPLLERLRAPLALLLDIARWFADQLAAEVEVALTGIYQQLLRRGGEVTFADLHFAAAGVLSGAEQSPVHDVAADLRMRWAEIVADGNDAAEPSRRGGAAARAGSAEEVRLDSEKIAGLVRALFPATGSRPAWAAAREHSPDLLLARTPRGLRWVLGELHLAMNTLENRVFHAVSDDPAELAAATAADMAGGRIVPCYPHGPLVDSRRYPPLAVQLPDRYLYWSFADDDGAPGGADSLPATALTVEPAADGLVAGPADGSWRLPVLEFFGEFLSALAVNHFRLSSEGRSEPRVVIDDVVVRRRGWHLAAADLPAGVKSRHGYRWRLLADHLGAAGLPRYLFAKTPPEPKPFFVDTCSPLLVTNLARSWGRLRDGERIELREMLPGPDELWLTDRSGQHYTTEVRMVAVDRRAGAGPEIAAVARARSAAGPSGRQACVPP
jgi:hypothetical protein